MTDTLTRGERGYGHRTMPWFGAGADLTATTDDEVLDKTGLNFTVEKRDLYTPGATKLLTVPRNFAMVRTDTEAILGVNGAQYSIFQHRGMVEFGRAVLKVTDGEAEWQSGGELREGKQAYVVLKIPADVTILGDEVASYLLLMNSHDGSSSFKALMLAERLFCTNQLAAAQKGAKLSWSIRHIGDLAAKVELARQSLSLSVSYMEEFKAEAERMAAIDMEVEEFAEFLKEMVPDAKSVARQSGIEETRAALMSNWKHSGTIADEWRTTRWGAYNAVTEYWEHVRDLRPDKRLNPTQRHFLAVTEGPIAQARERAHRLLTRGVR